MSVTLPPPPQAGPPRPWQARPIPTGSAPTVPEGTTTETRPTPRPSLPPPRLRRRWPPLVIVGVAAGVVAVAIAALVTAQVTSRPAREAAPVTVTVSPSASPSPVVLPAEQADKKTCQAWDAAKEKTSAAVAALQVIPKEITITTAAVRENPEWSAAVQKAADLYGQAADALVVTPGTTLILDQAAHATADTLRTLSTAVKTFDPANGNIGSMTNEAYDAVQVLCERLAPA